VGAEMRADAERQRRRKNQAAHHFGASATGTSK
jgi:hypothetical protein